jgi:hypothetical protein
VGGSRILSACRLTAAALLLFTACAQSSGTVRGPVVAVDGDLTEIVSFTLLVEGEELRFLPAEDGDYEFPLQHLRDHRRTGELVLVDWEWRGDARYALSVNDG